jgi:hypothetical protein
LRGVTTVACIQALAGILAVAGGPAAIGFPAVEGLLAVASIPAHPGVPIFASRFTYCTVQCHILQDYRTIGLLLSDCNFFCYRISDVGLNLSDYLILDSEKNQWLPTSA